MKKWNEEAVTWSKEVGNYVLNARRILLDTTVPLHLLRSPLDFIGMGVISAEKSQGLKRSYLI